MGKLSNISGKSAIKVFCNKELAPGLLKSQIKRSGLSVDEFIKILKKR